MAKKTPKIDTTTATLPGMFDIATVEGALDIDLGYRQCISRAMSESGKDRYQIASEMSRLMKTSITKEMLDKYAASDQANGMRASALTAFCYVCDTFEPFKYLLRPIGSDVLLPADATVLEWARLKRESRTIELRIKRLEAGF